MTRHRSLLDRLAELDPVSDERIDATAGDRDRLRDEITATPVDELAPRRRPRAGRIASLVAAAVIAIGLLVPVAILLPLAGNDDPPIGSGNPPSVTPSDPIEVLTPAPGDRISPPVTIRGTADVFEGTVSIRVVDATNNVVAETFTTATCGSGCRGDFEIAVPFSVGTEQQGVVEVYEESPEDGSRQHLVRIPVTLVPGPQNPLTASLLQTWHEGPRPVATGEAGGPLEMNVFSGPDHCGWTSVTFLHLAWPPGSRVDLPSDAWRQFLRDPQGLLADRTAVGFEATAELPGDASSTGYRNEGGWALWLSPSDDDAVYLVREDHEFVERWPHAPEPVLCA